MIESAGPAVQAGHKAYYAELETSSVVDVAWPVPPTTSEQPPPTTTTTIIEIGAYLSLAIEGLAPSSPATVTVYQRLHPSAPWVELASAGLSGTWGEVYAGIIRGYQLKVTADAAVRLAMTLKG